MFGLNFALVDTHENYNETQKMKKFVFLMLFMLGFSMPAMAGHIDQLGIKITLNSSDGNGNFSVKFEEFMGSDGWMWGGSQWQNVYTTPGITASIASGPGSINSASSFNLSFMGLVNAAGVATVGFGPGQVFTRYINSLNDAAVYSAIVNFTITGFDNTKQYLVSLSANDCCYVSGGSNVSFDGSLKFDPRQVVTVSAPATFGVMMIAMFGLIVRRMKRN